MMPKNIITFATDLSFFEVMPRSLLLLMPATLMVLFVACGDKDTNDESIEAAAQADSFATYYFNWRYVDAARFATPESRQALSFAASNVSDSNIVALRQKAKAARVSVSETVTSSDSTFTISLEATDYLKKGKIGEPAVLMRKGNYELQMVKRDGKWLVNMPRPLFD